MNITTENFLPIDELDEYKICSTFTEHCPHAFGWYESFEDCFEDFLFLFEDFLFHEST